MNCLWSAVLSWYRDNPLNVTCMEAPCSSKGWVLNCHSSVLMPGPSNLNMNSTRLVTPGRITPGWEEKQDGKVDGRVEYWLKDVFGLAHGTNSVWHKSCGSRCLIVFVCTRGGVEVEVLSLCLWLQVRKAMWQGKLLPTEEDGCAALIAQLQVRRGSLSSQGLKDYCGTDSYLALISKCWTITNWDNSKQCKSQVSKQ